MKHSNCLIEALKAFSKNMKYVRIKKKGSIKVLRKGHFPHFYWVDNRTGDCYHFEARYSDEPFLGQLWFEGKVTKYNQGGKGNEQKRT